VEKRVMKVGPRQTERHPALHTTKLSGRTSPAERPQGSFGGPALVLNRYRLEHRLGTGGFGSVWLARDERLEREVAVKILPRERVLGGRFEREARAAARLSHPAIVTLYEAAVDDDGAYLVSELVRGQTLERLLEAGRLSDRRILRIGVVLCDALAHAHAHGVVHRDVKPSNVLVPVDPASPLQLAKLADFGVARVIGGDTLTRTGDVVGTAAYMAPEQAAGREAGAPADLYSLALVVYEALTGVNPAGRRPVSAPSRPLATHLPPLRRFRRDLPRDLARGIDRALRPRARERGTVEDLRDCLERSLGLVKDNPGVVAAPWPARAPARDSDESADDLAPAHEPARLAEIEPAQEETEAERGPPGWPERAAAALVAALLVAWLSGRLSAEPPLPIPVASLLGALAVASLPRLGWLALVAGGTVALVAGGESGVALVLALGGALPVVALVRRPSLWPLPGAAVVLGGVGLAGAWPALAARAPRAWQRAALAAAGWLWLLLAGLLVRGGLYTPAPAALPVRALWASSPYVTAHHVLPSVLASGRLAPAVVWAAAAVILPPLLARRRPLQRLIRAAAWSAALVLATVVVAAAAGARPGVPVGTALLGGLAGMLVAVVPPFVRPRRGEVGA
jgi:serine/threonine protein kinase